MMCKRPILNSPRSAQNRAQYRECNQTLEGKRARARVFCKIVRHRNLLHGNFHGYAILLLGDSLPLLTQPIAKYGARKQQKKEDHGHLFVRNLNRVSQCSMQRQKQTLTLNLPTLDIVANVLWTSSINLAANAESSTENLLNTTLKFL